MLLKWLRKKIIKGFINDFIKDVQEFNVKAKVGKYIKENEEDIIEKIEEIMQTSVEKVVGKIVARFEDKT